MTTDSEHEKTREALLLSWKDTCSKTRKKGIYRTQKTWPSQALTCKSPLSRPKGHESSSSRISTVIGKESLNQGGAHREDETRERLCSGKGGLDNRRLNQEQIRGERHRSANGQAYSRFSGWYFFAKGLAVRVRKPVDARTALLFHVELKRTASVSIETPVLDRAILVQREARA